MTIFRCGFDEGKIGEFMATYYPVNPELLGAAPYELMQCAACSLVYQRFAGCDRLLVELYSQWIVDHSRPEEDAAYQADVSDPLRSRDGHEILVAADFLRTSPERMTVLDFGMGWGLWARIALQLGCRSYGYELSEKRVAFAKSHGVEPLRAEELGAPMFDFINAEQVMEHLRDLRDTAEVLARSLRPRGILKVSVPNAERAPAIAAELKAGRSKGTLEQLMPVHPLEHVNSFSRRSLEVLSEELGLHVVRPGLTQRYAFLKRRGSIALSNPRRTFKELVRPVYQYHNRRNIYLWMQKDG